MSGKYLLKGDLNQMAIQKRFLIDHGFRLSQFDVYLAIEPEEVKKVLTLFWKYCVEGWWCYDTDLIKYKICTTEEYLKQF